MFQTNTQNNEKIFKELMGVFKKTITSIKMDADDTEWDMKAIYAPNHACLWNKISNVGKMCNILEKDSEIAVVVFADKPTTSRNLLSCIYRLEDISLYKK